MKKFILCLCLFAVLDCLAADTTNTIHFQGRLTYFDGKPIQGKDVQVRFSLYGSDTGADLLWNSVTSQSVATNDAGLFATDIGPLTPDIFSNHETVYLSISVQDISGTFKVLKPRQKLSSVPYAIKAVYSTYAASATFIPANSVSTLQIQDGSITEVDLASNSVGSLQIKDGSIGPNKLSGDSITGAQVKDKSIGSVDLATDAVRSSNIQDKSIGGIKILDGTIGTNNLADASITTNKIAIDAVTATVIASGTVTSREIKNESIGPEDLVPGSLTTKNIATKTIENENIKDAAVGRDKLNEVTFDAPGYGLVPQGGIVIFLADVCPKGYTEATELRNRFPIGVDDAKNDPDVPDATKQEFGTKIHSHKHTHTITKTVTSNEEQKTSFDSQTHFTTPRLITKFEGSGSGKAIALFGEEHIHEMTEDNTPATVLPPGLTVLFCKKS